LAKLHRRLIIGPSSWRAFSFNKRKSQMAVARKLKDLAVDSVVLPSPAELYRRKCADVAEAKAKLADLIARQLKIESATSRRSGDTDAVVVEKRAIETKIERLSTEAALLKEQITAARPPAPLSDRQEAWAQAWSAAASHDPYSHIERGTASQIAAAQAELDALIDEYRRAQPTGNARDAWAVRKAAARTKLEALKGPPYPAHRPWASDETLKAARKAQGFKS
jgi:hypothetical protein